MVRTGKRARAGAEVPLLIQPHSQGCWVGERAFAADAFVCLSLPFSLSSLHPLACGCDGCC